MHKTWRHVVIRGWYLDEGECSDVDGDVVHRRGSVFVHGNDGVEAIGVTDKILLQPTEQKRSKARGLSVVSAVVSWGAGRW